MTLVYNKHACCNQAKKNFFLLVELSGKSKNRKIVSPFYWCCSPRDRKGFWGLCIMYIHSMGKEGGIVLYIYIIFSLERRHGPGEISAL